MPRSPSNAIACPAQGCRRWKLPGGCPVCQFCWPKVPKNLQKAWQTEYYERSSLGEACKQAAQNIINHFKK